MAIYDVAAEELIALTAEELKKIDSMTPPDWSIYVKTGHGKTRPPVNEDWWYVRSASILRKIVMRGPIGTSKLRTLYGNKKRRGYKSKRFVRASGSVIRKILQGLEKSGLIKKELKLLHKGRKATPQGVALLDKVSAGIMSENKIVLPKKSTEDVKPVKVKKEAKHGKKQAPKPKKKASKSSKTD